jgi:hypothetical protein
LHKQYNPVLVHELDAATCNLLDDIAYMEIPADGATCKKVMTSLQQSFTLTEKEVDTMLLAIAAAPSPAQVNNAVIETASTHLAPAGIVEIIVWLFRSAITAPNELLS